MRNNQAKERVYRSNTGKIYKPLRMSYISGDKINTTRYQRNIESSRVNRIIDDFRPEQVNALKVALRSDGIYYLIDGQHTYMSITQLFGKEATFACVVVDCTSPDWDELTEEQFEARIFTHQHDNTKQLSAQEKFKGGLIGAEKREMEIVNVLDKYGYTVQYDGRQVASVRSFACVRTIVDIYDRYGIEIIERMLKIIEFAYKGSPEALADKFINGIANFINTYDGYDNYSDNAFAKALSKNVLEPKKTLDTAKENADRSKFTKTRSFNRCLEDEFIAAFNKGKRECNRIIPE